MKNQLNVPIKSAFEKNPISFVERKPFEVLESNYHSTVFNTIIGLQNFIQIHDMYYISYTYA